MFIAKILIICFLLYMLWAFSRIYLSVLKKEGMSYQKLSHYPKIMVLYKVALPVLLIYFLYLALINIISLM